MNDELQHHGVKGMKWGVRKDRENGKKITTSKGKTIYLEKDKKTLVAKVLGSLSDTIYTEQSKTRMYTIRDSNGKKVGDIQTYDTTPKVLNVVWLGVKSNSRGQNIAQSTLKEIINDAIKNGKEKVTLEVPGSSKDARHIYEKMGFKDMGKISDDDDVWGGLTKMELNLNEIQHHGVKGMKWGVRKDREEAKKLSDEDLKKANKRMQAEENYVRLKGQQKGSIRNAPEKYKNAVVTGLTAAAALTTINLIKKYGAKGAAKLALLAFGSI